MGQPRSASVVVRLLTAVIVALVFTEGVFYLPAIRRERLSWMSQRLDAAVLIALAVDGAQGRPLPAALREGLQTVSKVAAIRVLEAGGAREVLAPDQTVAPASVFHLDRENFWAGLVAAVEALNPPPGQMIEVIGTADAGPRLDLIVPESSLTARLRRDTFRFLRFGLTVAVGISLLLYFAFRALLVTPLNRIARNIARFRLDPDRGMPLDAETVSAVRGDEITQLGRELSAMQAELRTALWRNARLTAIGTAVAKMSHDLRGILASALLVADRLTMSPHGPTRDAGEVIVRAVHRATGLAKQTLDYVREGPPPVARAMVDLHELAGEAGAAIAELHPACAIHNEIGAGSAVLADRESLMRVLTNLLRNAAQAGARRVTVANANAGAGAQEEQVEALIVADTGPGLPQSVQAQLFRPFAPSQSGGSGLGLAIARDLMRAHGGDLQLAYTGPEGTSFLLYLQAPKPDEE